MTTRTDSPSRRSPLYHAHRQGGALFRELSGWEVAASYTSPSEEGIALRESGGICDVSHLGKLTVRGVDSFSVLTRVFGDASISVGNARLYPTTPTGTDPIQSRVAVLTRDEALILTLPSVTTLIQQSLEAALEGCAHVVDITSTRAGIHVIGPKSHRVLSKIVELDIDPQVFPDGLCLQGKAAEIHVLVIRADVSDLLGYQLYVTRDFAEHLWEALLHAGEGEGVAPVGLDAVELAGQGT